MSTLREHTESLSYSETFQAGLLTVEIIQVGEWNGYEVYFRNDAGDLLGYVHYTIWSDAPEGLKNICIGDTISSYKLKENVSKKFIKKFKENGFAGYGQKNFGQVMYKVLLERFKKDFPNEKIRVYISSLDKNREYIERLIGKVEQICSDLISSIPDGSDKVVSIIHMK